MASGSKKNCTPSGLSSLFAPHFRNPGYTPDNIMLMTIVRTTVISNKYLRIACMKLVRCYLTIIIICNSKFLCFNKMLVPCFYSDLSFILEGKTFPVALTRSDILYIKGI